MNTTEAHVFNSSQYYLLLEFKYLRSIIRKKGGVMIRICLEVHQDHIIDGPVQCR